MMAAAVTGTAPAASIGPTTERTDGMTLHIGLTGGIGAGKSTVAARLAQRGAVVIDADRISRELMEPGSPVLAQVVEAFGPEILDAQGNLDRAGLARRIFGDEAARARLNGIVHPLVRERAKHLEAEARPDAVVVHVIPLLVETGQQNDYDAVIVVDVPTTVQVSRLMHRSGLTTDEAWARLRAQAPRTDRLDAATWVIDNSGSPAETIQQVTALWAGPIRSRTASTGQVTLG